MELYISVLLMKNSAASVLRNYEMFQCHVSGCFFDNLPDEVLGALGITHPSSPDTALLDVNDPAARFIPTGVYYDNVELLYKDRHLWNHRVGMQPDRTALRCTAETA